MLQLIVKKVTQKGFDYPNLDNPGPAHMGWTVYMKPCNVLRLANEKRGVNSCPIERREGTDRIGMRQGHNPGRQWETP